MGEMVDDLILRTVHAGYLSIGLFDFFGKSGVFNRKGQGAADHVQEFCIGLLKMTMLFVDGAEGADDTITAFQRDYQEILRQVAEHFVPFPVKFSLLGRIIDYDGLSGLNNPARNKLIH